MDTLERTVVTALIHHIARFLKSGIPIYNSKVPDKVCRKRRRRRTQTIAKCFAFHECYDCIVSVAVLRLCNIFLMLVQKRKIQYHLLH